MGATLTSITGLQNLTNLQDFRADWNSLTSIDISGLSNLQIVDISDNNTLDGDNTNSLASVNLTGCTNIAQLRLDGGNFTTGSNIEGLSELSLCTVLDLDDCNLAGTLDLSTLTSLESIDISNNTITNLIIPDTLAPISTLSANDNALTLSSVNNIALLLDESGVTSGNLNLFGGTNAVPSGSGRNALLNLSGKGWVINTNNAPGLTQRNNWYDATDTGSVCNHSAGFNTFYASGSLGIGTVAYSDNWGGTPTAEGWYQPNDDIDFTLYFVSGGVITTTASCS